MTFEELLPPSVLEKLPPLYASEDNEDVVVPVKLFYPAFSWTFYIWELDPKEQLAFGLTDGDFCELGYISIAELLSVRDKLGNSVERDLYFTPISLKQLKKQLGG